jgi:hypothetical protein
MYIPESTQRYVFHCESTYLCDCYCYSPYSTFSCPMRHHHARRHHDGCCRQGVGGFLSVMTPGIVKGSYAMPDVHILGTDFALATWPPSVTWAIPKPFLLGRAVSEVRISAHSSQSSARSHYVRLARRTSSGLV